MPPETPLTARAFRAAQRAARDGAWNEAPPGSLEEAQAGVQLCRRCGLWRDATQGVPGAGPAHAAIMLVGEQPGDQEDLAGRPFVGPAGRVLDAGLARAGIDRDQAFVTNAVKHFKHEPRGKRRMHKTPDAGEVGACRWWLEAERRLVRPRVVVALGATAALGVFGRPTPVGKNRGQVFDLPDRARGLVTYHPAFLLRLPDEAAKKAAFAAFVADLRAAARLAG
jgi:DNA polymerase